MVEKTDARFSPNRIQDTHEVHSTILWFQRGQIVDDDIKRINRDWFDARRVVGFKIADDMLRGCKEKTCYELPDYYLPYLNSLSLLEFKQIKAYLIWEKLRNRLKLPFAEMRAIYLEACKEIEQNKINCLCEYDKKIPENIIRYIRDARKSAYFNIIKRKAYWNSLFENCTDEMHNWKKAEKFTNTIYCGLESRDTLTRKQALNIIKLIDENHHLTNMFEYVMRCHLFKHQGLTRRPSHDERRLTYCAKTGEMIIDHLILELGD